MQIKLICSDIDGTLLNKERELSKRTISSIKNISHIPFILISSRMPQAMLHLQKELGINHLPMIAFNGGLIIDNKTTIQTTEIEHFISGAICKFCDNSKTHISLYHRDEWYVSEMDYWAKRESNNTKVTPVVQSIEKTLEQWHSQNKGAHKIMCMGDANEIDLVANFIKKNYSDKIIGYRSKPTYLEISPISISKKTAIAYLIHEKYPACSMKNIMAFGDNYNDIEMLKGVGIGIAVKNAKNEVLAVADQITQSNLNNGVASFIENYFQ
ncbi:MAG: Cof-type HAD-IIB family hydrolase [Flavobacteriaceae bacterium]|nr:Cof-type HAD-IIB family hydrolase [Flavobacteriaceae bacterium]